MRPIHYVLGVIAVGAIGAGVYFAVPDRFHSDHQTKPDESARIPHIPFTDVTKSAGIHFYHFNGAAGRKLLPETMGSGVAVLDFDRDGNADLLFVNSRAWPGHVQPQGGSPLALYRNKGDGTFEEVTESAGLAVTMFGMGAAIGDIDNDGFPDIYVTAIGGNYLFLNVPDEGGKRRFREIASEANVGGPPFWPSTTASEFLSSRQLLSFPSSATFLDFDGDGKLDLFVCQYLAWSPGGDLAINAQIIGVGRVYVPPTQFQGVQCVLYRNIDGTHFEDISAKAGIQVTEKDSNGQMRPVGKSLGVIICDPDGDGWPDIAVANDTERNFFFHNVPGPGGSRRYEEIGIKAGVAYADGRPRGAMGIDWSDYSSGKNALFIANYADEPDTFLIPEGPEKLLFSDRALQMGLAGPSRTPLKFGAFFFDYDLDGRMDIFTCNGHLEPDIAKIQIGQTHAQSAQLFWNTGNPSKFYIPVDAEQSGQDLFRPMVGRGCAYLDYDGDGDLDIVVTENNGPARLLRNDNLLQHHWIRFELAGDGKRSNRDSIGAHITVEAGGVVQHRYLSGARGYMSQSEQIITIGLGKADGVDRVSVRWPGKDAGPAREWRNLAVDRVYRLRQGEGAAKVIK